MQDSVVTAHKWSGIPNTAPGEAALHKALEAEFASRDIHRANSYIPQLRVLKNTWFKYTMPDGDTTKVIFYDAVNPPPPVAATHRKLMKIPTNVPNPGKSSPLTITREHATPTLDEYIAALAMYEKHVEHAKTTYRKIRVQVMGLLHHLPTVNAAVEAFPEIMPFIPKRFQAELAEEEKTLDDLPKEHQPDKELFIIANAAFQILRIGD